MTFSIGDQDHVLTPLSVLRWKKNGHQEPYFTRQISSQKLKIIIIIHKKENYITWVIQYKKKENMVYMKANIDVCCSLTFALSLKDHTRQLYHAKKDSHGWYSDFTSKRMDHKMNNNGSNYKKKKKKRQPAYDHKHNVLSHSAHEGKQKCRKGVILSATAAIGHASKIKGCYMCMHSSFASAPHFCLQSTPRKDTMKVEGRPYDSNYAIKISEN